MIKEVLQQLEPLDAQIDALCSSADDVEMILVRLRICLREVEAAR